MTTTERQRIAAILGMLGSSHAGERDNAAQAAEAFRRKHGLTWAQMLSIPAATVAEPTPLPPPPQPQASIPWGSPSFADFLGIASCMFIVWIAAWSFMIMLRAHS